MPVLALASLALLPASASAACTTTTPALNQSITCSGGTYSVTVPAGAAELDYSLTGAAGGGGYTGGATGGRPATTAGTLDLFGLGSTIGVTLGSGGARGTVGATGASGGGLSRIFAGATSVTVAGAGGGGGGTITGAGGVADDPPGAGASVSAGGNTANGGAGGTPSGGAGGSGSGTFTPGAAGTGGVSGAGGAGGSTAAGSGGAGFGGGGGGAAIAGGGAGGGAGGSSNNASVVSGGIITGFGSGTAVNTNGNPGAATLLFHDSVSIIYSVSPTNGTYAGGTPITVFGTGLRTTTAVTVGGAACTSVTPVSNTALTCTTPASGVAGAVNLVVTTSSGPATRTNGFTYTGTPPATPSATPTPTPTATPAPVAETTPPVPAPVPSTEASPRVQIGLDLDAGDGLGEGSANLELGNLKAGSPYRLTLGPTTVARGTASSAGTVSQRVELPAASAELAGLLRLRLRSTSAAGLRRVDDRWILVDGSGRVVGSWAQRPKRFFGVLTTRFRVGSATVSRRASRSLATKARMLRGATRVTVTGNAQPGARTRIAHVLNRELAKRRASVVRRAVRGRAPGARILVRTRTGTAGQARTVRVRVQY